VLVHIYRFLLGEKKQYFNILSTQIGRTDVKGIALKNS